MPMTIEPKRDDRPVIMVLVTDQFRCKRLTAGAERNPDAIEYLFQASRENNASMTIHYSASARPQRFLGELIQKQRPAAVVTGLPGEGSTLLQKLWMRFEDEVDFYVVDHEGELRPVTLADQAEVLKRA